ncbi:hypothetical protein, partial [Escherichia coli]|uniref:hypothetical protein n=1 Tax=Escherichia coli TaxID=562 RepID=UPI0028DF01B1
MRLIRKIRRLDERKALGTLLVRKPRAALRSQQIRGDLRILLPKIIRLSFKLHCTLEDGWSACLSGS